MDDALISPAGCREMIDVAQTEEVTRGTSEAMGTVTGNWPLPGSGKLM